MAHEVAAVAEDISIHALREESDMRGAMAMDGRMLISIHALREESDPRVGCTAQSNVISIHALREESDPGRCPVRWIRCYFNPRSP